MGNPILAGLGFSLPKRQVSNHDLVGRINTSDEFIVERTGVRTRYHVEPEQAVSALMVPAARQAIEAAGLLPEDIDLLLVNTLSPDHHDPSQACLIQPLLGLRHIPVLDIRAQCSGLLYGLQMARGQILAGLARHVLVVCGEVLSKRMDCSDRGRNLSILLGDGAGAVVVSAGESLDDGLLDLRLGADGNYFDLLMTAAPGSASPTFLDENVLREGGGEFLMRGRPMFEHASQTSTPTPSSAATTRARLSHRLLSCFIPSPRTSGQAAAMALTLESAAAADFTGSIVPPGRRAGVDARQTRPTESHRKAESPVPRIRERGTERIVDLRAGR